MTTSKSQKLVYAAKKNNRCKDGKHTRNEKSNVAMKKIFIKKNSLLLVAAPVFYLLLSAFAFSSCGIYSFSQKGTVEDSARTVKVATFDNKAPYVNPQVSPALSERLRQKIISQTKLANTNNENADYNISGYVADYSVTTTGVTSSNGQQQSSLNRLTVRVQVSLSKFGGQPEEFSVSRSFDFSAQQSLQAAEASLLEEMIRNLTDEIFNHIFSNW